MKKLIISSIIFLIGCGHAANSQTPCHPELNPINLEKQNYNQIQISLLEEHNKQRKNKGLEPFEIDKNLCIYAQKHAENMAKKSNMYHSKMNDLNKVNTDTNCVGENVAWGQENEKEVVETWMHSPGHRSNILNKNFKRIGFGAKQDSKGRIYWCTVFSN